MGDYKLAVDRVGQSHSSDQYTDRREETLHSRVSNALRYLARQGALPAGSPADQRYDVGMDAETHEMVVRVLDKMSGDLLYQMPTKSVLRMAAEARQTAAKSCSGRE